VILADLTVDNKCNVTKIDCFAHRRYVVSFADYFETCVREPDTPPPTPEVPK
jgi:hypothetical protein